MTRPVLWTDEQISEATQAHCTAPFTVSGVSIDTRSLEPGDLFVALPGRRATAMILWMPPLPPERRPHSFVAARLT